MPIVDMTDQEWASLLNVLATTKEHPWATTNPLLMKIGQQLQYAAQQGQTPLPGGRGIKLDANGKEIGHE